MAIDQPTAYPPDYQRAGDQCSSTSEGRYVNFVESVITHPAHASGLVEKGDPCLIYEMVGVAMNTATSTSDIVSLDTEGIWYLVVESTLDVIYIGQRLYIDNNAAVIDDPTYMPFGWALDFVPDSEAKLIAVKVHATEWPWWVLFLQP